MPDEAMPALCAYTSDAGAKERKMHTPVPGDLIVHRVPIIHPALGSVVLDA